MNSPTQLKVLSTVWRTPGLSRSELGALVGLHANTITRMVDALIRKGYLREGASGQRGHRGRPKIPLEVDPARTCVGGIAIGAGGVEAVALNLLGQPQGEVENAAASDPAGIAKGVARLLRGVLAKNPLALGVSVTGFVDPESRRILWSSAAPAAELDLAPLLARAGETPVVLNSEVHALGMRWLMNHVESEHDDTLVVTLEDGAVGASLLVGGRPYTGCVLGGNELGHMSLNVETARCYCGGTGCVERVFSTDFLHRLGGRGSLGDAFAAPALSAASLRIIDLVALGLANATVFARPHRVVVAGMLGRNDRFRDALSRAWRQRLPAVFRDRVLLSWYETKATLSAETAGWLAIAGVLRGPEG
jgi:predicted NBD/HSP70 family sugar kinase